MDAPKVAYLFLLVAALIANSMYNIGGSALSLFLLLLLVAELLVESVHSHFEDAASQKLGGLAHALILLAAIVALFILLPFGNYSDTLFKASMGLFGLGLLFELIGALLQLVKKV